jgi:hypothetical protein
MFRNIFAIGFLGIVGCTLCPVTWARAGEAEKVDPTRQLVFKVKGLT